MKTMGCGICGRRIVKEENLIELVADVKIDGVSEVCRPCLDEINKQSLKLSRIATEMKESWLRKWIGNFKASKVLP